MAFTATEGSSQPIVTSRKPIPKPPFRRDLQGHHMIDNAEILEMRDVSEDKKTATVIARRGDFVLTFHAAQYQGWYTGNYGIIVDKGCICTWERDGDSN